MAEKTLPPLTPVQGGQSILPDRLQPGDIIVTAEAGIVSSTIGLFSDAEVSHSMVYIGDGEVIESVKDGGVSIRTLQEAIVGDDDNLAVVYRYPDLDPITAYSVINNLLDELGKGFDSIGIVSFPIRCGDGQSDNSSDQLFCSELIATAYSKEGIDLSGMALSPSCMSPNTLVSSGQTEYVGHLLTYHSDEQDLSLHDNESAENSEFTPSNTLFTEPSDLQEQADTFELNLNLEPLSNSSDTVLDDLNRALTTPSTVLDDLNHALTTTPEGQNLHNNVLHDPRVSRLNLNPEELQMFNSAFEENINQGGDFESFLALWATRIENNTSFDPSQANQTDLAFQQFQPVIPDVVPTSNVIENADIAEFINQASQNVGSLPVVNSNGNNTFVETTDVYNPDMHDTEHNDIDDDFSVFGMPDHNNSSH